MASDPQLLQIIKRGRAVCVSRGPLTGVICSDKRSLGGVIENNSDDARVASVRVRNGAAARRAVKWTTWLMGMYYE
eukprot:1919447-Prymnesium_polylepis.2